jgi:hypothetical protein
MNGLRDERIAILSPRAILLGATSLASDPAAADPVKDSLP